MDAKAIDYNQKFRDMYDALNDEQRAAVDTIEGPVFVMAGPGTGKTQMLTLRIANILTKMDIAPENILALTFTNAGVAAMRTRLADIVGPEAAYRTGIYTFHSFCEEQITTNIEDFVDFYGARVADEIVRTHMIEEIVRTSDVPQLRTFASDGHYVRDILRAIDELKREGVSPVRFGERIAAQEEAVLADDASYYKRNGTTFKKGDLKPDALKNVRKNKDLQKVYAAYQERLRAEKLYDFADMVLSVVEKVEHDEAFRTRLQEQFLYVLVDEHQDTNDAQNRLIVALGSATHMEGRPNIFAVGDAKQSIYRFQGASVENFQTFADQFRDVVRVELTANYRSGQAILDAAHALMLESTDTDAGTPLVAAAQQAASITATAYPTYEDELHGVVQHIATQIADGVAPEDIALFYRNNAHLDAIVAACEKHGVPYTVASVQDARTDRDLSQLFWLLRAAADPMASDALARAMLVDFVQLNRLDVVALFHRHARGRKKLPLAMLTKNEKVLRAIGITKVTPFMKFMAFLEQATEHGASLPFDLFFEDFLRTSGFLEHAFAQPRHQNILRKLTRVFREVTTAARRTQDFRLRDFLGMLDMMERYGIPLDIPWDAHAAGIRLMTAHGSKGLEFAHVYITNAVESVWGKKRSLQKFQLPINRAIGDIEDERRLFYVALTRAKETLHLSWAQHAAEGKEQVPVRFLTEIPTGLVDTEDVTQHAAAEDVFALRQQTTPSITDPTYVRTQFFAQPLSASTLNNYFTDPLVYFFRNIVRLPSPDVRSLIFGSLVHGALEDYFSHAAAEKALPPTQTLFDAFDRRLERELILHDEYDRFAARGREALQAYVEQRGEAFTADVQVEEWIGGVPFTLENGEDITLVGKIDKMEVVSRTKGGGAIVRVIDYKTGTPWSKQNKAGRTKLKRQMAFYKLLLDGYAEGQYVMQEAQLHFIEPNAKGVCEVETYTPTEKDMSQLRDEINTFAKDVLSDTFLSGPVKKTRDTEALIPLWKALQRSQADDGEQ